MLDQRVWGLVGKPLSTPTRNWNNTVNAVSIGGVMTPTVSHRAIIGGLEEELTSFPQNMSDQRVWGLVQKPLLTWVRNWNNAVNAVSIGGVMSQRIFDSMHTSSLSSNRDTSWTWHFLPGICLIHTIYWVLYCLIVSTICSWFSPHWWLVLQ